MRDDIKQALRIARQFGGQAYASQMAALGAKGGGRINTTIDRDPDWDMGLADGGEVDNAMRVARLRLHREDGGDVPTPVLEDRDFGHGMREAPITEGPDNTKIVGSGIVAGDPEAKWLETSRAAAHDAMIDTALRDMQGRTPGIEEQTPTTPHSRADNRTTSPQNRYGSGATPYPEELTRVPEWQQPHMDNRPPRPGEYPSHGSTAANAFTWHAPQFASDKSVDDILGQMRQRADGGEVDDALRIARDRLGTGGRPQQIGGYNFHPEFASDRDALIRAMYAEAGNQSPEGMAKVGYNIRNRADADYGGYGHDIQKQILAQGKSGRGGQYSSFLANRPETNIAGRNAMKLDPEGAQYKKIGDVADRVLGRVERDPTMGASHYYAPQGMPGHRAPKWANDPGMKFLGQEGAHKFYQQAGFNPEQSATPMKLGDTAMLQGAKPSEQAMQVAGLGTMGDTQMRLPDAMQAAAPVQVAKAELPAMHVGSRAPEPAPMRVAQAAPVAQARTPISEAEPTTTPQHAATPEASPRNIAASDTGPGTSAHEFVQSQGVGVPEQPMPDVQAPEQPMEMASVEPPDMTAGLENMFSGFADGGAVSDALRIAQRRVKPMPLHQTLARRGYATDGGVPDEASQAKFIHKELEGSAPQYDPEGGMKTAEEAGQLVASMTTPGAIADAAGYLGGPSALQNVRDKNYGTAALQVASAIPGVGPLAKAGGAAHLAMSMIPKADIVEDALKLASRPLARETVSASDEAAKTLQKIPEGTSPNKIVDVKSDGVPPLPYEDTCVVHSVAHALGKTPEEVWEIMHPYYAKGGIYPVNAIHEKDKLGFDYTGRSSMKFAAGDDPWAPSYGTLGKLLDRIKKEHPDKNFIIETNNHVLSVNKGQVQDIGGRGPRTKVRDIWEVTPHEEKRSNGGLAEHALQLASGGGAWTRKEGKNPKGGLNAKGRASLKAQGHDIKPPQPEGGPRRDSFCSRMKGMKKKLTSKETANDPNSRINKSLRAWNCADGGEVWDKPRPKKLGKSKGLTDAQQASAKASAKAAGRPYPNLVDNMKAARKD